MEDLTSLRHFCGQRGVGNQGKWVALPHADLFSREVANALLKLIEEPPKGLRVVLFAEHADVLPTIRSRVAVRVIAGLSGGSRHDDLRALASQLDPLRNPAQARAFCYAAPMIHAQVSLDLIRDAFQS
jgi:DNA polymerase-3 subunit delta'